MTSLTEAELKETISGFLHDFFDIALSHDDLMHVVPLFFVRSEEHWKTHADTHDAAASLDCQKGCAHCCHLPVMCPPDIAFFIARALKQIWPADQLSSLKDQLSQASKTWVTASENDRHAIRLRCPFLDDENACRIYEIRPFSCRSFSSKDKNACERLINEAENQDVSVDQHDFLYPLYQAATTAMHGANQHKGRSFKQVYFLSALSHILDDESIEHQWLQGSQLDEFARVSKS